MGVHTFNCKAINSLKIKGPKKHQNGHSCEGVWKSTLFLPTFEFLIFRKIGSIQETTYSSSYLLIISCHSTIEINLNISLLMIICKIIKLMFEEHLSDK